MRVLIIFAMGILLLPAAVTVGCWKQALAEDDTNEPPAEPVAEAEDQTTAEEEAEPAEAEETADASDEEGATQDESNGQEEELPEGVRRRPITGEQERWYKQRKTREDPFLNPPGGLDSLGETGFYNPAEWLRPDVYCGVSRYIVQDSGGKVIGYSTLAIEQESDAVLGDFIRIRRIDDLEPAAQTEVWIFAETFKPRTKEVVIQLPPASEEAPGENAEESNEPERVQRLHQDTRRLDVDYLFDRMTIVHRVGGITARRQMRQLPFSYDIDELPFLARQLIVHEAEWPFEAVVCDPANETHLPMSIAQPQRMENVMDANVQQLDCYEFTVRVGESTNTYLVQRIPPHQLVKFTESGLTYTLSGYLEQQ